VIRSAALLLATGIALAGCGERVTGEQRQQQEQVRAAQLGKLSGWVRAFQPDVAVGAANQFGFHAPAYAAADGGFASKGGPVTIANSFAKRPNAIAFAATGKAADKVDTIAFDLALTDKAGEKDALTRTATLVRDYLFQSKIDAKPIHDAIASGAPGQGQLAGADYAIERADGHLVVTFSRTGASAPANSQTAKEPN
jgi:hypothetical protein